MHITLVLLFCSLISVSVRAGRDGKKNHGQPGPSIPQARKPQPGQIIGVIPANVKHRKVGSNDRVHPAVFVDMKDDSNTAWVVIISNNFMTHILPPHLRGDVEKYYKGHPQIDVVKGTQYLSGKLDLSKYSAINSKAIRMGDIVTIMSKENFEAMTRIINSNKISMESRIAPFVPRKDRKDITGKFTSDQLGSIETGQILLFKTWSGGKYIDETYPGIFVSWVGGGKLAIVRVFKELEKSNNKAEIVTYSFTPETMELKSGKKSTPLAGVISRQEYQFVPYNSIIIPDNKITMNDECYGILRKEIDDNIEKKKKEKAHGKKNDGVPKSGNGAIMGEELTPRDMERKRPGSHGPSSTTTNEGSASSKEPTNNKLIAAAFSNRVVGQSREAKGRRGLTQGTKE